MNLRFVESRPGYTTGGAGRVGRGGAEQRRFCASKKQLFNLHSRESNKIVFDDTSEARTYEIQCKAIGGTQSAADERYISGATVALCSRLWIRGQTLFCLLKLFSCKACLGIIAGAAIRWYGKVRCLLNNGDKSITYIKTFKCQDN